MGLLSAFIQKIERIVKGDPSILEARLTDDMFPLITQVEIAASFALRASCPIANIEVVSFIQSERSFQGIQTQLRKTIDFLHELEKKDNDLSVGTVSDMAGPVKVTFSPWDFLTNFALPNFFFHVSMVYAIAKSNGVPATKGDYDGIHQYPEGFSFEQ